MKLETSPRFHSRFAEAAIILTGAAGGLLAGFLFALALWHLF